VNAVAIADVVHVVVPPRWSVTVTTPMAPEIVLTAVEDTSVPRATLAVGVLIESAPAVSVKLIGVAAEADGAIKKIPNSEKVTQKEQSIFLVIRKPPNPSTRSAPKKYINLFSDSKSSIRVQFTL